MREVIEVRLEKDGLNEKIVEVSVNEGKVE